MGLITITGVGTAFSEITPMVAASASTLFLSSSGALQATGQNFDGQLGIGDKFSRSVFHSVSFPLTASRVWAGPMNTYVLKSDGTLWTCGSGSLGLLGDSQTNSSASTLIQVGTQSDWKEVSLGDRYVIGIKEDGSLWSWGFDTQGALGLGFLAGTRTVPTRIGTATDWQSVAAGANHNLALTTGGTLWAWGGNQNGQVGNGNTNHQVAPLQIGTLDGWQSIAAGRSHSLAVRTDGSLWAWGSNSRGQLGNNSSVSTNAPVRIGTSSQWKAVSASSYFSLGQLSDNTLQAWGTNTAGQLGVGDTEQRNVPTAVANGWTWLRFDAGEDHCVAIKSDGTLAVWGSNGRGQLGPATAVVTAPQTADLTARPEISLSRAGVPSRDIDLVADGAASLSFPLTPQNSPQSVSVTILNHGTAALTVPTMTAPNGVSIAPPAPIALAPGASQVLTATLSALVPGNLTGSLIISSNDADEADFDVSMSGTVLSLTADTDEDGLNDAAEFYYSSLGFRYNKAEPTLVAGASRAGLLTPAQLLAGTLDSTVVESQPGGSASLRLHLERSLSLTGFYRTALTAEDLAADGSMKVPLIRGSSSEFFRFAIEPLPTGP